MIASSSAAAPRIVHRAPFVTACEGFREAVSTAWWTFTAATCLTPELHRVLPNSLHPLVDEISSMTETLSERLEALNAECKRIYVKGVAAPSRFTADDVRPLYDRVEAAFEELFLSDDLFDAASELLAQVKGTAAEAQVDEVFSTMLDILEQVTGFTERLQDIAELLEPPRGPFSSNGGGFGQVQR